jgi:2-methylisocitrate lyase-like PEP mutase family enzyme
MLLERYSNSAFGRLSTDPDDNHQARNGGQSMIHKRAVFRTLHENGCFVMPNPWDVGSARYLQHLGFKALATTSSGYAWTRGRPDNFVGVADMLTHLAEMSAAVDVPTNADFEAGYAQTPEGVANNVTKAVAAGVSGLSIEDASGQRDKPLYDLPGAIERVKAARLAIDASDPNVLLTARAECFLVGVIDLKETIRRLEAYALAGADCLYAPGIRTQQDIATIVRAVAPKPVNVLVGGPGQSVARLRDLGVRRISVGGALARTAWGGFARAAQEISERGTFELFTNAMSFTELNGFFSDDLNRRPAGQR